MVRPRTSCAAHDCTGSSIIELVIVVALIGISLSVAAPLALGPDDEAIPLRESQRLRSDLRLARMIAVSRRTPTVVTVDKATGTWVLSGVDWSLSVFGDPDQPQSLQRTLPNGASFSYVSDGANDPLVFGFDKTGLVNILDGGTWVPATDAVELSVDYEQYSAALSMTPAGSVDVSTEPQS